MIRLLVLLLVALSAAIYFGTDPHGVINELAADKKPIYHWEDDKGMVHFEEAPPTGKKASLVDQSNATATPTRNAPASSPAEHATH